MKRLITALLLTLAASTTLALEGKWTPQQVLQLDPAMLKKEGLQIAPSKLWDPKLGSGLLAATVHVGGCSGGFVSSDGLFITNHHCLFSILQEHATPENDIITNGFLAAGRDKELRGGSLRMTIPRRFTDVTAEIRSAVPKDASDSDRFRAIERKSKDLITECEKRPASRCQVPAFDGGVQYVLIDADEISDVRLVYAPPRAIGEYGGETDNWMWPRHTGDFAIGRAYVNGSPLQSPHYFPISAQGVKPDDFVMVIGYPGITYRALTAPEMTERRDLWFTRRQQLYGEWIHSLEQSSQGDPAGQIAVAATLKSLDNNFKNAEGQLAGFRRGSIVEKQSERDEAVLAWAKSRPAFRDAIAAYGALARLIDEQRRTWEKDFLLERLVATNAAPLPPGPKSLYFATSLVRSAIERAKNDADRDPLYSQRNLERIPERFEREQKNYFAPGDQQIFASVVRRALAFPAGQRVQAIDSVFSGDSPDITARIGAMYAQTKLFNPAERTHMLTESVEQLQARHDPLLDFALALNGDLRETIERRDRWDGSIARLRPEWRRAVIAQAGRPVAPDANGTLRVSFAHVKGYAPRDGVFYVPQTTLAGVIEKHTGAEPFNVPRSLLDAAARKQLGRWKDDELGDVPVNFLADADTTGGNSGSPTVNGRGELVGVNFDRVWENVANDFGYNPAIARNVNVDIRYLLWLLSEVDHAGSLLKELGVR